MGESVRVRIAPSPTGYVHMGNTYTAYYNYIFAKQQGGRLILRLDDTDLERHVSDAEEKLYELWRWLGLTWDEGPDVGGLHNKYRQSERLELYRERAEQLVKSGHAYHNDDAIFLRVADAGAVEFTDLIRGNVRVEKSEIKDQVLIKRNGYPTYMFATVVDDIDFAISHVIRAEDHLSNTPKQILMYEALDAALPQFAHLPLLRNPDRSKLSKRQAHTSLAWYQEQGFLPAAIKNYFALLGWSHPEEKEIFDEVEFVEKFSLERINTTAPVFDLEKLRWMGGEYVRRIQNSPAPSGAGQAEFRIQLEEYMQEFQPQAWEEVTRHKSYETLDSQDSETIAESQGSRRSRGSYMTNVLSLAHERLKTLGEFWEQNKYFWQAPEVDRVKVEKFWPEPRLTRPEPRQLSEFVERAIGVLSDKKLAWKAEVLEKVLREVQTELDLKPKQAFMTLRLIVTGQETTPPLFDTLEVMGREEVMERLKKYLLNYKNQITSSK